ncbi:MAG TPA: EboA domain-containing protein [Gammaproteobacteria bacterium]
MTDPLATLTGLLAAQATPAALAWYGGQRARVAAAGAPGSALGIPYALARRQFGAAPLADTDPLPTACGPLPLHGWTLGDSARVALLLAACADRPECAAATVQAVYTDGDDGERIALVRALALLDADGALLPLALDVTRTNSVPLFAALAQHNPYPAARFADHDFDHLVLKALFIGVALGPVHGLRRRAGAELARMCADYVDERLAAGRSVPQDIWLALAPHAGPHGLALLQQYLADPEPGHRFHAAVACGWRTLEAPGLHDALARRLDAERDPRILAALQASLAAAAPD